MLWVEMDLFSAGAWRWLQLWLSGARLISDKGIFPRGGGGIVFLRVRGRQCP